jgi:probable rRNA maturation factor
MIESSRWNAVPEATQTIRRAISATAQKAHVRAELSVVLTNDASIRALNYHWRKQNKPTNVLSFPAGVHIGPKDVPRPLGDIVIAYETLAREAKAEQKPFLHHLAHLSVHGFLHLLGYDHDSEANAEKMEQFERTILARLGIPDPYRTGTANPTPDHHARPRRARSR